MNDRTSLAIVAMAAVLASAGLPTLTVAQDSQKPDLSGVWSLNPELSDDPRETMRKTRDRNGFGGRAGNGPGSSGGGFGGRGGGRASGRSPEGQGGDRTAMLRGAERLSIEHHDHKFVVRDANQVERVFSTSKEELGLDREVLAATVVYPAKWKKGTRLVTTRENAMGGTVTETYELAGDGAQLLVTVEIEGAGKMPKLKLHRVYDREDDDESDAPSQDLSSTIP